LQDQKIEEDEIIEKYRKWVFDIQVANESHLIHSATSELKNGIRLMMGFNPGVKKYSPGESSIILGTYESINLVDYGISYALFKELGDERSEEHTSELQSRFDLVCRLLLEKKKNNNT